MLIRIKSEEGTYSCPRCRKCRSCPDQVRYPKQQSFEPEGWREQSFGSHYRQVERGSMSARWGKDRHSARGSRVSDVGTGEIVVEEESQANIATTVVGNIDKESGDA